MHILLQRTYCNIEVEKSGEKGFGLMSRQKIKKFLLRHIVSLIPYYSMLW